MLKFQLMFKRWGNVNIRWERIIQIRWIARWLVHTCAVAVFFFSIIYKCGDYRKEQSWHFTHSWNPWHGSFFFFSAKWWNWNATTESDGTLSCRLLKHRVWIGAVFLHGCAQIHFPLTRGVDDTSMQPGLIWNEITSKGDLEGLGLEICSFGSYLCPFLVLFCSHLLILFMPGEEMYRRKTDQLWKFRASVGGKTWTLHLT